MNISSIDKNFAVKNGTVKDGIRYFAIPSEPFDLYGVFYEKETGKFARLPSQVANGVSDGVMTLNYHTSGGRIRFSTDSDVIAISVSYETLTEMSHMPLTGSSGFVLLEETEPGFSHVKTFMPLHTAAGKEYGSGVLQECTLKGGEMRDYILFFPLYNDVKSLSIGVSENAKLSHGKKYRNIKPVLYYGSSITQGGCASRPDNSYQAIISKRTNTDFINLGFSGSAKGEKVMAEYLASVDCSVFVCDYDHNAPSAEYLEKTHYSFYKTYRNLRRDVPIIFITRPNTQDADCEQRKNIIFNTYSKAIKEGDKKVWFINGGEFFRGEECDCTVDGGHPTDYGFFKMANVIYAKLKDVLGEDF